MEIYLVVFSLSKSPEDRRELSFKVAEVGSDWDDRHCLLVVRGSELWTLFLSLYRLLSLDSLNWVWLVVWEFVNSLVVTTLRRV